MTDKSKCKDINRVQNIWQEYNTGGVVDTANAAAVSFANVGTNTAYINGFPLAPGQCLSSSAIDKCTIDCTSYNLTFPNNAGKKNSVFVFMGESSISFTQILASSGGGGGGNVNIFDSAGNILKSTGFQLWVIDAGTISAVNTFATANHADLVNILNTENVIKTNTNLLAGQGGMKIILGPSAALSGLSVRAIVVLSAATFAAFKIGGVDQRSAYGLDISNIPPPCYIASPAGSFITDITVTVGMIAYYL